MCPRIAIPVLLTFTTLLCGPAQAQPLTSGDYDLEPQSRFTEGCLEPCMCPIWSAEELTGSFELYFSGMDGSYHLFHVLDVAWDFSRGPDNYAVRGSGTYRIDPDARMQRLELDLVVGEDAVDHYDSGLVPVDEWFPRIGIAIAMNDFYCFDRVFEIIADLRSAIRSRESSWGTIKARY